MCRCAGWAWRPRSALRSCSCSRRAASFITGVTLQIDGAASLGSEIFPLAAESKSVPFDGFHRATTPEVLK